MTEDSPAARFYHLTEFGSFVGPSNELASADKLFSLDAWWEPVFLTTVTHWPCWGLHTERDAPPFLTLAAVFSFSLTLSVSRSLPTTQTE